MGLFGPSKDERETTRLLTEARRLRALSRFQSQDDVREWIVALLFEVCDESDLCLSAQVAEPLGQIVFDLLAREAFLFDADKSQQPETLRQGAALRTRLRVVVDVLRHEDARLGLWREAVKAVLLGVVADFPVEALSDPDRDGNTAKSSVLSPARPLAEMVGDLPHMLTSIIGTLCAGDLTEAGLFHDLGQLFDNRLCIASGIPWQERFSSKRKIQLPIDRSGEAPGDLAALYMADTPFADLFALSIPIPIPGELRFEHMHIVGGTGHGKTQALQYLLLDDLERALTERLSVVVLDPDGTLIRTVSRTAYFQGHLLGKRTVIIDPAESVRPIGLNLFDAVPLAGADPRAREVVENNTIELFEYFFDALLGSELTGRQSTLFRYLGLLLMRIPGGNIHTLRQLLQDGKPFLPHIDALDGTAQAFFKERFFQKDMQATKSQILSRLWGVLSKRALDRLFSAKHNSLDLDEALQTGSIIFVHTSKEYLGEEGSAIFARMVVALLGQALMRRAAIPPDARTPTYIYIDEAEGVVDQTLVRLLAQVRKYKGAITLAHQHLDQLPTSARSGVFTNTAIKLAGGISAKDAGTLAPEMRTRPDYLLAQRKHGGRSEFALYARGITPSAMQFAVPLGYAERFERLSDADYVALIEQSRDRYGYDPSEVGNVRHDEGDVQAVATEVLPPTPPPPISPVALPISPVVDMAEVEPDPTPIIRKEGGGGVRHQAIIAEIKERGEAAGFRVSVEETILEGEGRVDVVLRRGDATVAFEVSVTTTKEHELLNVRKCLRAGFREIVVVAAQPRHQLALSRFIAPALSEGEQGSVRFLSASELEDWFDEVSEPQEKQVKGYTVRSRVAGGDTANVKQARAQAMRRIFGA